MSLTKKKKDSRKEKTHKQTKTLYETVPFQLPLISYFTSMLKDVCCTEVTVDQLKQKGRNLYIENLVFELLTCIFHLSTPVSTAEKANYYLAKLYESYWEEFDFETQAIQCTSAERSRLNQTRRSHFGSKPKENRNHFLDLTDSNQLTESDRFKTLDRLITWRLFAADIEKPANADDKQKKLFNKKLKSQLRSMSSRRLPSVIGVDSQNHRYWYFENSMYLYREKYSIDQNSSSIRDLSWLCFVLPVQNEKFYPDFPENSKKTQSFEIVCNNIKDWKSKVEKGNLEHASKSFLMVLNKTFLPFVTQLHKASKADLKKSPKRQGPKLSYAENDFTSSVLLEPERVATSLSIPHAKNRMKTKLLDINIEELVSKENSFAGRRDDESLLENLKRLSTDCTTSSVKLDPNSKPNFRKLWLTIDRHPEAWIFSSWLFTLHLS